MCACTLQYIWYLGICIQVYVIILSFWVLGQGREMDAPDWGCVSFLSPVRWPTGSWPWEERENTPRWVASTGTAPRRSGSLALAPTGWYTPLTPGKHKTELYWHILKSAWNYCKCQESRMTMCFDGKKKKPTKRTKKPNMTHDQRWKKDSKYRYKVQTLTGVITKCKIIRVKVEKCKNL